MNYSHRVPKKKERKEIKKKKLNEIPHFTGAQLRGKKKKNLTVVVIQSSLCVCVCAPRCFSTAISAGPAHCGGGGSNPPLCDYSSRYPVIPVPGEEAGEQPPVARIDAHAH